MMESYELLEKRWADWNKLDPRGMVVCSSGTAALHLALEAMHLPRGEVATGDFNMVAVPRAIVMAGLHPVFIDCNDRLLMESSYLRQWVETDKRKSAIIATHIYGRRCDMHAINYFALRGKSKVVEDLSEAHGVYPHSQTDAACWSFYKNKIIAGEEGGAVWFCNPTHAERARCLRSLGFTPKHDMTHVPRGHNYRMSNLHAGAVLAGMDRYNPAGREKAAEYYQRYCPSEWTQPVRKALWVWDFRIPGLTSHGQDTIIEKLKSRGIAARHGFKPMTAQEEFSDCPMFGVGESAVAAREVIYLPLHSEFPESFAQGIFTQVREWVSKL